MVLGETFDVMIEGVQGCRCQDAGLAHTAAEELRSRRPRATKSRGPARAEPTGAPSPLLKQTETVSNGAAQVAAGMPLATSAFHKRARQGAWPDHGRAPIR